jgi:uncharacterized protein YecE (DUF72 family)
LNGHTLTCPAGIVVYGDGTSAGYPRPTAGLFVWEKSFYPAGVPPSRQLQFYATQFPTVEINGTFYRLPTQKTFSSWNQQAPPEFLYSIKGNRPVTHFKRLRPGAKSFRILLTRSRSLRNHLGPILWQLPGTLKKDVARLESFLRRLKGRAQHANPMPAKDVEDFFIESPQRHRERSLRITARSKQLSRRL